MKLSLHLLRTQRFDPPDTMCGRKAMCGKMPVCHSVRPLFKIRIISLTLSSGMAG